MHIFLTGGTGLIGRPLVRALHRRGWTVTALVRNPQSKETQEIQAAGAQLAQGDVTKRESMRYAMTGADAVIHNAGWYEYGISSAARAKMQAINVAGTENTIGLAVELGIPKIVYTSTVLAYGATGPMPVDETYQRQFPFHSTYETTKTEAHEIALRYQQQGAPLVIVCPAGVIGAGDQSPWGWFVRMYVRGIMPPIVFAKHSKLSLVAAADVAETLALAVEKGRIGETYLCAGEARTIQETLAIWAQTPGGFKPLGWMPAWLAMAIGTVAAPILRMLGLPAFLSRETMQTVHQHSLFSAAKAERELGIIFRSAEQMWLDTLATERAAAGKSPRV